jgi:hypothetical protein
MREQRQNGYVQYCWVGPDVSLQDESHFAIIHEQVAGVFPLVCDPPSIGWICARRQILAVVRIFHNG